MSIWFCADFPQKLSLFPASLITPVQLFCRNSRKRVKGVAGDGCNWLPIFPINTIIFINITIIICLPKDPIRKNGDKGYYHYDNQHVNAIIATVVMSSNTFNPLKIITDIAKLSGGGNVLSILSISSKFCRKTIQAPWPFPGYKYLYLVLCQNGRLSRY